MNMNIQLLEQRKRSDSMVNCRKCKRELHPNRANELKNVSKKTCIDCMEKLNGEFKISGCWVMRNFILLIVTCRQSVYSDLWDYLDYHCDVVQEYQGTGIV